VSSGSTTSYRRLESRECGGWGEVTWRTNLFATVKGGKRTKHSSTMCQRRKKWKLHIMATKPVRNADMLGGIAKSKEGAWGGTRSLILISGNGDLIQRRRKGGSFPRQETTTKGCSRRLKSGVNNVQTKRKCSRV